MRTEAGIEDHRPWPRGLADINAFYGNPDANADLHADPVWELGNLVIAELPYPMRLSWGDHPTVTSIRVHYKCRWALLASLRAFLLMVGLKDIQKNGWDFLGGAYNFRPQTGNKKYLSVHSWGAAIDLNPHLGEYGKEPNQPKELIEAFAEYGAEWGGDWPRINPAWPSDGMHWQFCSGY